MPALLGSLALVVPAIFVAVPTFQQSLITAGHPIAPEQCACAASPPASNGELKWCQSVGKPHETLADKTRATPTDSSAWKSRRFDFMGTGVFQLARTKGACACSDHDDVEVQSFMCGTKYWGKGASTNAAIAVRVQGTVFVISAQDDVLSVSGSENAVLAPVDEELERAFGLTVVTRETTTYKSDTRYAWRIAFPGGGSLLALRWPVGNLPTGAMLHTWTSLPQSAPLSEGLCASECPDLPASPCGAFEAGSSYVSDANIGKCVKATSAWSCSHQCWEANRGEDVRFTYMGDLQAAHKAAHNASAKACCCKQANATAVSTPAPAHVSGRACKKPCGASPAHCLHTKSSEALFNATLRKSLEETCGLLESTRPDEEPTDCSTAPPVSCGAKHGFKDRSWTGKFDWRLVSPKSNSWTKPKCIRWCEGAVLKPQDHMFNNHWEGDVCKLRKSLLAGDKVRCGWDTSNQKCSLFVGKDMKHQHLQSLRKGALRQRKSMVRDCTVRVENITECPPDVEDVCAGTGIPLGEAEEACARHNNTDNFDWCVFDYCATNGDPEVPEYWHPPGNATCMEHGSCPPSLQAAASLPDATEPLIIKLPLEPQSPPALPAPSAPPHPHAPSSPCTSLPCPDDGSSTELSLPALDAPSALSPPDTPCTSLPCPDDGPSTELDSTLPSALDTEHTPKFVVSGRNRHFWVPTGKPTPLLEWTAHEGGRTFVLTGETFGQGASEWFRRYALLGNGTEVLHVGIADAPVPGDDSDLATPKHPLRTLGVWVDGAAMHTTGEALKSQLARGVSALATSRKWGMIGSAHAEEVEVHAPGMHLTIGSLGAKVYDSENERVRWAHLDIQIHGSLPTNSSGFVAELAGLQPLSDASKRLLAVPKEVYREKRRRSFKSAKKSAQLSASFSEFFQ